MGPRGLLRQPLGDPGGGGVVMLRVIETEDQNQQWLGVADIMRAEAHEDANAALDRASGRANGIAAITPERVIREGDPTEQILDVIDKDVDISMLVLAANPGPKAPAADHHDRQGRRLVPDSRYHRARRSERRRYRRPCHKALGRRDRLRGMPDALTKNTNKRTSPAPLDRALAVAIC